MIDSRVKNLIDVGDKLFGSRPIALWQALAENLYPMRADFIYERLLDDDLAGSLMSSVPVLMCRELADSLPSMMRPRNVVWAELHAEDPQIDDDDRARPWMEWATGVMNRAMYDPDSGFVRATKEADYDWVAFGQAIILPGVNHERDGLLYQTFHLKDCAWSEGVNGKVNSVHRKWKPTIYQLCKMFPKTVSEKLYKRKEKEPNAIVECRHIVVPADIDTRKSGAREKEGFLSFYVDVENNELLEETTQTTLRYVVPRWKTISSSPYARAPVAEIMLPDARTFQALSRILLEQGEKSVDPELIAAEEVFRSDMDRRAGGVTWADLEYDQKLTDKFAVLNTDKSGMAVGFELSKLLRENLAQGFYLNKMNLPPATGRDMTAYETRKRLEEHVRQIAPLFEPVEEEYNAPLLNETFEIMKEWGGFGPFETLPETLRGQNAKFKFLSPLRETEEEANYQRLLEGLQVIQAVAPFDNAIVDLIDVEEATRDSLRGIRFKSSWMRSRDELAAKRQQLQQQQMMMQGMQEAGEVAGIAEQGGKAIQELQNAGIGQET